MCYQNELKRVLDKVKSCAVIAGQYVGEFGFLFGSFLDDLNDLTDPLLGYSSDNVLLDYPALVLDGEGIYHLYYKGECFYH